MQKGSMCSSNALKPFLLYPLEQKSAKKGHSSKDNPPAIKPKMRTTVINIEKQEGSNATGFYQFLYPPALITLLPFISQNIKIELS